jgi:hypothetical protein
VLQSIAEVTTKIATGKPLLLAGSESALSQLPKGNWIAGTTSYFMDVDGCTNSASRIFVDELPDFALRFQIAEYSPETLPSIFRDAPQKGFSFLILAAGSPVHIAYAKGAPRYEGFIMKPVAGWVSGTPLAEIGRTEPKVFNGQTGESFSSRAVVMHVELPPQKIADLEIINFFKPGSGDAITFPESGFTAGQCQVNGKPSNFAEYISRVHADTRLPLTANYNGSVVNVSIQSVDEKADLVRLYAPVFAGIEYRFAAPVDDYVTAFDSILNAHPVPAAFACNCILNYVHGNLEGKSTGSITGPITFGEIAYQLLNQTLVRLTIHDCA